MLRNLITDKVGRMFSQKVTEFAQSLGIKVKTPYEFECMTGEIYPWTANGLYSPPFDIIACNEFDDFVLLHEIIHWSGHQSRADRFVVRKLANSNRTDLIRSLISVEDLYNEEAIANMGMFMLATYLGLDLKIAHYEMNARLMFMHYDYEFCEREVSRSVNWILDQVKSQAA